MTTKHVVSFSGGVDSQACAGVVLDQISEKKEDVVLVFADTGNEHPLTLEHVEWYSKNVHPVLIVRTQVSDLEPSVQRKLKELYGQDFEGPVDFEKLIRVMGIFPSNRKQFCTHDLKILPMLRLIRGFYEQGCDVIRYTGVRADESKVRAKNKETEWDPIFDCETQRPILRWTKQQCFDFCLKRDGKVNKLYSLGFQRASCAPCFYMGKEDLRELAARNPEQIEKVARWEKMIGKTFFSPEKGASIHEVVQWARTTRGGKQFALPFIEEDAAQGNCASRYGLCDTSE